MMFLTEAEIEALTGKKRRPSQVEALHSMGYEHSIRPDGNIIVLRAHVEEKLGLKQPKTVRAAEPNWGFLNA